MPSVLNIQRVDLQISYQNGDTHPPRPTQHKTVPSCLQRASFGEPEKMFKYYKRICLLDSTNLIIRVLGYTLVS